jgi:hypothetical protein
MRKELAQALRKSFEHKLKASLPQFHRARSQEVAGNRLFVWEIVSGFYCYVQLIISPYWDEFTLEGAWSTLGAFPSNVPPLPRASVDEIPTAGAMRFPLSYLSAEGTDAKRDEWWSVAPRPPLDGAGDPWARAMPIEEGLRRVEPLARDAVQAVVHHAVPYFQRIADRDSG